MQEPSCNVLDIATFRMIGRKQWLRTGDIKFGQVIEGHFPSEATNCGISGSKLTKCENDIAKRRDLLDAAKRAQLLADIRTMAATKSSYGDRRIIAYRNRGWDSCPGLNNLAG